MILILSGMYLSNRALTPMWPAYVKRFSRQQLILIHFFIFHFLPAIA